MSIDPKTILNHPPANLNIAGGTLFDGHFDDDDAPMPPQVIPPAKKRRLIPLDLRRCLLIDPPPLDFVIPGIMRKSVALFFAAGATGKTIVGLQLALSLAAGVNPWGLPFIDDATIRTPKRVMYIGLEDPVEVVHHRLRAMWKDAKHRAARMPNMKVPDLEEVLANFMYIPVLGEQFSLLAKDNNGRVIPHPDWFDAVAEVAQEFQPDLIMIDTLNRLLGSGQIEENSNAECGATISILERLAFQVDSAIMLFHHISKGSAKDGRTDQQASRGASAIIDNSRWACGLAVMTPEDAAKRGVDDEGRRLWVGVDFAKTNYIPPKGKGWLCRNEHGILTGFEEPPEPKQEHEHPKGKKGGGKSRGKSGGGCWADSEPDDDGGPMWADGDPEPETNPELAAQLTRELEMMRELKQKGGNGAKR